MTGRNTLSPGEGGRPSGPALSRGPFPWVTAVVGVSVLLAFVLPGVSEMLQYDRSALAGGEWWRSLTGHVTHWNGDHLFWDLSVFVILGALCERTCRRSFGAAVASSALLIPLAVWVFLPGMELYRGLSGIDSALYLTAGVGLLRERGSVRGVPGLFVMAAVLTAFCLKIGYEVFTGQTVFVADQTGFVPVPVAHLAGAAAGAAAALLPRVRGAGRHSHLFRPSGLQRGRQVTGV